MGKLQNNWGNISLKEGKKYFTSAACSSEIIAHFRGILCSNVYLEYCIPLIYLR